MFTTTRVVAVPQLWPALCEGPNVNCTYAHRAQLIETTFDWF